MNVSLPYTPPGHQAARPPRSGSVVSEEALHGVCALLTLAGILMSVAAHGAEPSPILLRDVTAETGIGFVHTDGSSGKHYIVESVSCGLATFDYDGDGLIDIYFLNGSPLRGSTLGSRPENKLYRNRGNWRFEDVTASAGVGDTGYGLGVVVGDYDNDGDPDLYLNNYGPNVLYRNEGEGRFTDVTEAAGVARGAQVGAGACFLDIDADGDLDLYVANYVDFTYENHRAVMLNGYAAYANPMLYDPVPDVLYRNNGDGTFTDVSEISGIADHRGTGMGMVCSDFDGDGDTDIFVGNDVAANFLFLNDGRGRFQESALLAGVAFNFSGMAQGTMGADAGDYNNDGRLDLYITSYQQDTTTLYENLGDDLFEDVTQPTGAGAGTLSHVSWGCALPDLDNDGDRDLFIALGHLQDNIERFDNVTTYAVRNLVLMNRGDGTFVNVSDQSGDGLAVKRSSRGVAVDDLDNDGDLDVVVLNTREAPTILRNESPRAGRHWLEIELRGTRANRGGVGARVTVTAGDLTLVDEVHSGRGYQSHYGSRLHFGLGVRERVDRVEVRWIGGGRDVVQPEGVDRLVQVVEGQSPQP